MSQETSQVKAGRVSSKQRFGSGLAPDGLNQSVSVDETLERVFKKIPPLWSLQNFVAVNPFLGFLESDFLASASWLDSADGKQILMPKSYYLSQYHEGRIRDQDLEQAAQLLGLNSIDKNELFNSKSSCAQQAPKIERDGSLKDFHSKIQQAMSRFCAAYFDQGQALWSFPWKNLDLFEAWKKFASIDRSVEFDGLSGFRSQVSHLADDPREVIHFLLPQVADTETDLEQQIYQLLSPIAGWCSHVQFRLWQGSQFRRSPLLDLLAIRLAYEVASQKILGAKYLVELDAIRRPSGAEDLKARAIFQLAFELGFRRELLGKLSRPSSVPKEKARKTFQLVFCIDVRSEVMRRHLESLSGDLETLGFAGFFGFPIDYRRLGEDVKNPLCPVLLKPKYSLNESIKNASSASTAAFLESRVFECYQNRVVDLFKNSALSSFTFVESLGIGFGLKLFKNTMGKTGSKSRWNDELIQAGFKLQPTLDVANDGTGLELADQVGLATGALKNMGLTSSFAKIVMLCGHGSECVNNAYATALDCGACGGNSGEINARVAALVLNNPRVREALEGLDIKIPADTWFLAATHKTATDEFDLFDVELLPTSHRRELENLKALLKDAGSKTREERMSHLVFKGEKPGSVDDQIFKKSKDWSEIRPEWGLVGNAAFIVAPRDLTQDVNLGGRTFLHSYEAQLDQDGKVLELIMIAPMVVASWINLQYYASSVHPEAFGSGNKVTQNVVGRLGVIQGNGSDLLVGLPRQSVYFGEKLKHEPIRLQVVIEAPLDRISKIIQTHQQVKNLIENSWISLLARAPGSSEFLQYSKGNWIKA